VLLLLTNCKKTCRRYRSQYYD